MGIIFFEGSAHLTLRPLTFTRPVADLRIGILTIAEKWSRRLNEAYSFIPRDYLREKFPVNIGKDNLFINGAVCPDENLVAAIAELRPGQALKLEDKLLAVRLNEAEAPGFSEAGEFNDVDDYSKAVVSLCYPEDIFKNNDVELRKDFQMITRVRRGDRRHDAESLRRAGPVDQPPDGGAGSGAG